MAVQKKTHFPPRPKIRRGAGQISQEQAEWVREQIRKRKEKYPKTVQNFPIFGHVGQPQRGAGQPQPAPVETWWKAIVFVAIAILAFIVIYHVISYVLPDIMSGSNTGGGSSGGGGGSGCPTDCGIGLGVVVASQCNCPSSCPHYTIISNPPSMSGYKQCYP